MNLIETYVLVPAESLYLNKDNSYKNEKLPDL